MSKKTNYCELSKIAQIAITPDEQEILKRLPQILDKPTTQDIADVKNYETIVNTIYTKSLQFKNKAIKKIIWKSFALIFYIFIVMYSLGQIVRNFDKVDGTNFLLLALFFVGSLAFSLVLFLSIGLDYYFDLRGYLVINKRIKLIIRAKRVFKEYLDFL